MTDKNPACAMMTANCPPQNNCQLQAQNCWMQEGVEGNPNVSVYAYSCLTCGQGWHVEFPQANPTFDRDGAIVALPQPTVVPV